MTLIKLLAAISLLFALNQSRSQCSALTMFANDHIIILYIMKCLTFFSP